MSQTAQEVAQPAAKLFTAWISAATAIGINTWADAASFATMVASFLAAIYTFCLVSEWFWKKLWRPLLVRFGWMKPLPPENPKK